MVPIFYHVWHSDALLEYRESEWNLILWFLFFVRCRIFLFFIDIKLETAIKFKKINIRAYKLKNTRNQKARKIFFGEFEAPYQNILPFSLYVFSKNTSKSRKCISTRMLFFFNRFSELSSRIYPPGQKILSWIKRILELPDGHFSFPLNCYYLNFK